jgi:hypothetical protein
MEIEFKYDKENLEKLIVFLDEEMGGIDRGFSYFCVILETRLSQIESDDDMYEAIDDFADLLKKNCKRIREFENGK